MTIEIPFDAGRQLGVHAGMRVDFSTSLYKQPAIQGQRVDVAETLRVSPKSIFSYLTKNVGDKIQKGDILAQRKTLFSTHVVTAESEGTIAEVDHIEGIVFIEPSMSVTTELCWFCGEIEAISKGHITLKIGKHFSLDAKKISDEFGGEVWYFKEGSDNAPDAPVAVAPVTNGYDVAKLDALGIKGLITAQSADASLPFPYAILRNESSISTMREKHLPYCVTQAHHSTIIFYSL